MRLAPVVAVLALASVALGGCKLPKRRSPSHAPPVSITTTTASDIAELPHAPPVRVDGWAGSDPRDSLARRPQLVAIWATWCPGCKAETPFISATAAKYRGRVDVYAVTDEGADDVKRFKGKLAAPVAFPIAYDHHSPGAKEGTTWGAFFEATNAASIAPYGFIVHDERIVWHGMPGDATAALDEVLATGDAKRARQADTELALLKKTYLRTHASVDGEKLLEAGRGHGAFLNSLAWDMVDRKVVSDLPFVVRLARAAVASSQESDFAHLDTLGLALWKSGEKREALTVQRKAIALCNDYGGTCPDEKKRLAQFEAQP